MIARPQTLIERYEGYPDWRSCAAADALEAGPELVGNRYHESWLEIGRTDCNQHQRCSRREREPAGKPPGNRAVVRRRVKRVHAGAPPGRRSGVSLTGKLTSAAITPSTIARYQAKS